LSGAAYVHDIELPGMVYGRILRPPNYGSQLKELNREILENLPGVIRVVVDGSFVGLCAEREEQALRALDAARAAAKWSAGTPLPEQKEIHEILPTLAHETSVVLSKNPSRGKAIGSK